MSRLLEDIRLLTAITGPSGREGEIARVIRQGV